MTHECERVRQWLSAELDGEVSEFERALATSHLARCPSCSAFGEAAARISRELRQAPLERFDAAVDLRRRRRMRLRVAPAVAALAVAAVGLGSVLTSLDLRSSVRNAVVNNGAGSAPGSQIAGPTNLFMREQGQRAGAGPTRARAPAIRHTLGGPVRGQQP